MKKNANFKVQIKVLTVLLIFTTTCFLMNFPTINTDSPIAMESINEDDDAQTIIENEIDNIESPALSTIGYDPWWNGSFNYRKLINITNPYGDMLENFTVSIEFNYTELGSRIQGNLNDIRIVENGVLIEYFVKKDFNKTKPENGIATVYFQTTINPGETKTDTYLYYGNNIVGQSEKYLDDHFKLNRWGFDNGSGDTAYNSMGIKDGTLTNMDISNWVEDSAVGDYALDFDSYDYINLDNNLGYTTEFSAFAWFKSEGIPLGNYHIIFGGGQLEISIHSSGYIRTGVYTTTGRHVWNYGSGLTDGNWHSVGITFNNSIKKSYIDGVLVGEQTTTGTLINDFNDRRIGRWGSSNTYYANGIIDDARIYNYVISNDEIGWLNNSYILETTLNEEQPQFAEVKVITYDVDGRIVPNAEVSLVNITDSVPVKKISNTTSDGSVVFSNLTYGVYNFTVNYTLRAGLEKVVYNSTALGLSGEDLFNFSGLYPTIKLELNISTFDFEVVDWQTPDPNPLTHGYISIFEEENGDWLKNLTLDSDGLATFRWLNRSKYYYKIYYDNDDYSPNPTPLNESYIYRSNYIQNQKFFNRTIWVNQTNTWGVGSKYHVNKIIYTNGSLIKIGNKKVIKANITLSKMVAPLDYVKIYYIDKDGNSPDHFIIYSNTSYGSETGDFIEIDIRIPQISNQYLINDNYESYGLRVEVLGNNVSQQCNGIIEINTTETNNIYNRTALSKIKVQVVDVDAQWEQIPVSGVLVHVIEGSIDSGNYITNLTTDTEGYAHGQINSDVEFWYLNGHAYNFTLDFFSSINTEFKVNKTDPVQWKPGIKVDHYNYTLDVNSSLIFDLILDSTAYRTNFTEYGGSSEVFWGQNMTFEVNFSYTDDDGDNWKPINDPDEVICNVGGLKSIEMIHGQGDGNFTVTINSSEFSAGGIGESYWIQITGKKAGYSDPESINFLISINAIDTDIKIHSYSSLVEIEEISQHYNELVNVTVRYRSIANDKTLYGATLSYIWQFGAGVINPDLRGNGYYTFEINTSDSTNVGKYKIDVSAQLENYTSKDSSFLIDILVRPTTLNETTSLLHNSTSIWINNSFTFTYDYFDTLDSIRVGKLETAYYYWYKIDETGNPIGKPSANTDLVNQSDNTYLLDFKTENREPGDYAIFVTLQKNNYEARNAFIDLSIKYREISVSLKATGKEGSLITVVKGKPIIFSLTLTDPTKTSSPSSSGTISMQASNPLKGATVKMVIAELDRTFTFKEGADGVYTLTIDTTDPDYQAFFMPQTLTANITISKTNYVTQTIDITIVIGMDEWPIPGFPAFYFLMIVGAIIAVVGSLATYRYIQLAKIPKFVKNARAMKKTIKEREEISESLLYPSKEEYMVKILGDKWEAIGLSLEDILGIERKKSKIAPGTEEITEDIDGGVA